MAVSTGMRDDAIELAKIDAARAYGISISIPDGWFKAQALAHIAFHTGDDQHIARIIDESFAAAMSCQDPYKAVGSSAWPLSALVNRGVTSSIAGRIDELIAAARRIGNHNSRSEAMFHVFQAVFPLGPEVFTPVLNVMVEANQSGGGHAWRTGRNLRDTALFLNAKYPELANKVATKMFDDKWRRQAMEIVQSRAFECPRNLMAR